MGRQLEEKYLSAKAFVRHLKVMKSMESSSLISCHQKEIVSRSDLIQECKLIFLTQNCMDHETPINESISTF